MHSRRPTLKLSRAIVDQILLLALLALLVGGSALGLAQDAPAAGAAKVAPTSAAKPASAASAAAKKASENGKTSKTPPIFYMRDGSKVAGTPVFEVLHVETKYGVLRVPASDLLRVRLISRVDPDLEKKIADQIERLGSDDFDTREDAMDRLRDFGAPALPAIRAATSSKDEETKNRAEILAEEIQSNLEDSETGHGDEMSPTTGAADEIVARRFKIKGHVREDKFRVKTRYGELEFNVADVLGVDFRTGGKIEQSLSIPASKTIPGNWVSTKASVQKGQRLTIKASGNLHQQNYGLSVGPGGTTRYGSSGHGTLPMLSLVGKIGKKGKPFLIGPSYKGKASASGTLYVGIVPFRRNYAATGTFKVKLETD